MARSNSDRDATTDAPPRLRVPASLAVVLVGATATVAMSIAGCEEESMPDPVDASVIEKKRDGGVYDGGIGGSGGSGGSGSGDEGGNGGNGPDDAGMPPGPPPDVPDL